MVDIIRKRDGSLVPFHSEKITRAIFKAAKACGGNDYSKAEYLGNQVRDIVIQRYKQVVPTVEDVQDIVEKVLIENGHAQTAKAYILYREKRKGSRELNALVGATIEMFSNYLDDKDWQIKENANTQKSINGLNNYVREVFTKQYWLNEVYPLDIKKAHETGDLHLHDLGFFGAYCAGWDLRQLLMNGFGGIAGKIKSHPAKHLRAFLGQVVNSTFTTQGECYSDDTEVLTNNGWKLFKDLDKQADTVYTRNMETKEIELQKPIQYFEYDYTGKLYNFKGKMLDILVTPGHKMLTHRSGYTSDTSEILVEAQQLAGETFHIPKGGKWKGQFRQTFELPGIETTGYSGITKKSFNKTIDSKPISMLTWLKFMGIYLSEGSIYERSKGTDKRRNQPRREYLVRIAQKDYKEEFENILNELGFNYTKNKGRQETVNYTISNKQLFLYLEQFGKSGEKYIPEYIKNLDNKSIEIFLYYLYLGDGHISEEYNTQNYYTKSKRLADDVQELHLKIGYNSNILKKSKEVDGKYFEWYEVSINKADRFTVSTDMQSTLDYTGKVYCVEVPNHTLFIRRNGRATWCGNCAGAQAWSSFDTYCAPFLRKDNMTYAQVKQAIQEFMFNMNVPTRVGFQCLSKDTQIMTADGWKSYDEIHTGDSIFTFNISTKNIECLCVKNMFVRSYKGKMYNIKNELTDQLISPQHRVVRKDNKGQYIIETIESALSSEEDLVIPVINGEYKAIQDITINNVGVLNYDGIIWCPSTDNGTIIARRNGKTFITGNCPFSNLTFDIKVPKTLKDEPVIIGGEYQDTTYGDYQHEMDIINKAFCEVMLEGDAQGRVFTFPIPTINITKNFNWDNPVVDDFMKITCKYGSPYFANYVTSDLSPEDAVSMCCRLRLNTKELRKRGGGLFGSNPMTGSVGVVTINMPRIGYLSNTVEEFKTRLYQLMKLAKESLEIKRKVVEDQTEKGLYPYSSNYLQDVRLKSGQYWFNHFNTVGLVGMNEACINFLGKDITTPEGNAFAVEIMNYMRDRLVEFQEETGHVYNLEATPAEGTSYRLAKMDRERYPDIVTAGKNTPFYTNSTQAPVGYTDDIFELMDNQNELQSLYTGGTVQHLYLGESIEDIQVAKKLIQKVFSNYKIPYVSITPTFSICPNHGYVTGEHFNCPICGEESEVWSRVTGYLRPVQNFHVGKKEEYMTRKKFVVRAEGL